ncbi:hypothetical protein CDAR_12691 [Caerostris darwini]|uniref:Uncharacterized protein n=1 Tax=Caerostris darwini TaxID=1538125 RepID=A0AAV4PUQ1_9ARAC|nr:hypothetical protein CDAR_12691 [Caerostris darwini]
MNSTPAGNLKEFPALQTMYEIESPAVISETIDMESDSTVIHPAPTIREISDEWVSIAMDLTADLDSDACNSRKLLQDLATFKKNFPTMQHVFSTGNGPLKNHLQVPSSSAAAEAMLTEPPLLSDADHCTAITAARAQLKDKVKAVDLIQQILQNQNILIDGGVIQRTALKPTMDGLKTAEAALAEATKRVGVKIFNDLSREIKSYELK